MGKRIQVRLDAPVYDLKQMVYLVTDPDQHVRLVSGIVIRQDGYHYLLVCGEVETEHYDFEISDTIDYSIKTSN